MPTRPDSDPEGRDTNHLPDDAPVHLYSHFDNLQFLPRIFRRRFLLAIRPLPASSRDPGQPSGLLGNQITQRNSHVGPPTAEGSHNGPNKGRKSKQPAAEQLAARTGSKVV